MNDNLKNGREIVGIVVSEPKNKTLVIETERLKKHRLYDKNYKINKKIKASCLVEDISVGDRVLIRETRPISKFVSFKVVGKVS
ncbi:MAG: 30S ribosomal protein S17 [Patescibacteria group bacterium]|jgi:small subunit ribosomal protein S17|nr:30S ribosomal protein S17 [Patescibacteria group bacterium]